MFIFNIIWSLLFVKLLKFFLNILYTRFVGVESMTAVFQFEFLIKVGFTGPPNDNWVGGMGLKQAVGNGFRSVSFVRCRNLRRTNLPFANLASISPGRRLKYVKLSNQKVLNTEWYRFKTNFSKTHTFKKYYPIVLNTRYEKWTGKDYSIYQTYIKKDCPILDLIYSNEFIIQKIN